MFDARPNGVPIKIGVALTPRLTIKSDIWKWAYNPYRAFDHFNVDHRLPQGRPWSASLMHAARRASHAAGKAGEQPRPDRSHLVIGIMRCDTGQDAFGLAKQVERLCRVVDIAILQQTGCRCEAPATRALKRRKAEMATKNLA